MGESGMGSALKQTLKNLCYSNGWSYGVFWHFDHRNSMLLSMEDAYYEQKMGPLVDNMLLKSHILGEGIIGQAALTGKHQWIVSQPHGQGWNSTLNENIFQDESELHDQFSSGIKTIAVVSVGRRGVLQFGSTQKIFERLEFLAETEKLFYDMGSCDGHVPLEFETCNLDELFASLTSGGNFYYENVTTKQGGCSREPPGWSCSLQNLTESSRFVHDIQSLSMNLDTDSRINCLATNAPCPSPWNSEGSILTSYETPLPSGMGVWDPSIARPKKANGLQLGGNAEQNLQGSAFKSFCCTRELVDAESHTPDSFGKTKQKQDFFDTSAGLLDSVITQQRSTEEFNLPVFTTDLSSSLTMDNLSQWFSPSPQQHIHGAGAPMTVDPSCSVGVICMPSIQIAGDAVFDIPVVKATNSSQSSITDAFISNIEKSSTVHDNGKDPFSGIGMDFRFRKARESSEDAIMPLLHGNNSAVTSGISSSASELDVHSITGKRKGLFSELGLEELLGGVSNSSYVTKSSVEDQFSTVKRMKTGISSSNFLQYQLEGLSCSVGSMNLVQSSHTWDNCNNTILSKEVHQKSQVGVWIDDSYSVNAGNSVAATAKKPTWKRAKPGESTRPRPKDRQLIQDHIKELRGIVPHSRKQLSIDHLLEKTIKYLLFLQGVTKYADKIKQADEPKLVGQKNGKLQKQNTISGDATWAFEVGAQSFPIVVKDLNPPGQMLIEMLCEDRGFFLEIAEVIRGFPLNILKGVMELQEDMIWARFMVEADKQVERTGIIWSLLPLLQPKESSGIDSATQPSLRMDGGISLLNSYQQPLLLPTVSLAETHQ